MHYKISRDHFTEMIHDNVKELHFDNDIIITTDINFTKRYNKTESPVLLRPNIKIYIKTCDVNSDIVNVIDLALSNDLPSSVSDVVTSDLEFVKDLNIVNNKLLVKMQDNKEIELELSTDDNKTDSPDIDNLNIFTNTKNRLDIKNYNKNILYSSNSEYLEITSEGIFIKPISTVEPVKTIEVSIFATEQGKVISNPTYVTVTVINLEPDSLDEKSKFITGRLFTIDNIKEDDIISYRNITIDLSR